MRRLRPVACAALAAMTSICAHADYEFVSSFGSFGSANGQFDAPRGIAVNASGDIVIAESGNDRVQICDDQGNCSSFGGTGTLSGEFDRPRGLAIDTDGKILIADRGNERIQRCDESGSCSDFDGSPPLSTPLNSPRDVDQLSDGRIVISDTNNDRIVICDSTLATCTTFGTPGSQLGQFNEPTGVAVDSQDRIVISDRANHRIQICDNDGSTCSSFGGLGSQSGQFDLPADVAVDSSDNVVVADRFNDRIQICTQAGACSSLGSFGTENGQFNAPWGVDVDAADRIIVVDSDNDRIQIFADTSSPPAVSIDSFGATPDSLSEGQSTTLEWSVSNATSCIASGDWSGSKNASNGSEQLTLNTAGSYTFNLDCTGEGDPDSASVGVNVSVIPPVSIDSFGATPDSLSEGESTTLEWSVSNATSCTASGDWSGSKNASSGSEQLTLNTAGSYTFNLDCTGEGDPDSASVGVNVNGPPVGFVINSGVSDAWYDPDTAGQGFFIATFPSFKLMFIAWFTYEVERPDASVSSNLGEPGHRWLTAFGPYEGDTALLDIEVTTDGVFNQVPPTVTQSTDGLLRIEFNDCSSASAEYSIDSLGLSGIIPLQRVVTDNIRLCESLQEAQIP